ncbi:MAG: DUF4258 domain-containing protein [Deltaproteobacteria bacterium]|nr:DUF4258 domain-containing protein [Deltaproteobacteria bacterium]
MIDNDTGRLSPEKAGRKIKEIARLGFITPTRHLTDRMAERGYDFQDLEQILSSGKVKKPPEYDEEYGQWKYRVEGETVDGEKATVVVAIVGHNEILGITIMDK